MENEGSEWFTPVTEFLKPLRRFSRNSVEFCVDLVGGVLLKFVSKYGKRG